MSILDTFYVVYKSLGGKELLDLENSLSDSSNKLFEDFKKSDKQVEENAKSLLNLGKVIEGIAGDLFKMGTAAFSAYSVVHQFKEAFNFTNDLGRSSQMLATNIQDLDAWESAVMRNGGTADGFKNSLAALTQNLNITGDTALKILPQLADSFKALGPITATRYGRALGLDDATIRTLMQGTQAIEALIAKEKELGAATSEDAAKTLALSQAWADFNHTTRISFTEMGDTVYPLLTDLIRLTTLWLSSINNIKLDTDLGISNFAKSLMNTLELLYKYLKQRLPDIENMFQGLGNSISHKFNSYEQDVESAFPFLKHLREQKAPVAQKIAPYPDNVKAAMSAGQQSMNELNSHPLLAQNSQSIYNSSNIVSNRNSMNKQVAVKTGPITIQTQATDANGIAQAFNRYMQEQFRQVNNYFDDGIQT